MTHLDRWAEIWKDDERCAHNGLEQTPRAVVQKLWVAKFNDIYFTKEKYKTFLPNILHKVRVGNEKCFRTTALVKVQLYEVGIFLFGCRRVAGEKMSHPAIFCDRSMGIKKKGTDLQEVTYTKRFYG
ncbi:hypothetical protein AVEN_96847-1 [Araneus ventricosus]|uniref:Uncharacterized protein n=1 Tax=Araneus ventricosus TaxID=182803 RepID=A0A4Y2U0I2_ARAVE|nr:hypothetical protein AVEN_96847-1 [Araneus ventricosus]